MRLEGVWWRHPEMPFLRQSKFFWKVMEVVSWKEGWFLRKLSNLFMIWKLWLRSKINWWNLQLITSIFSEFLSQSRQTRKVWYLTSGMFLLFLWNSFASCSWVESKWNIWLTRCGCLSFRWKAMGLKSTYLHWWEEMSWVCCWTRLSTIWMGCCQSDRFLWFFKKKHQIQGWILR